MSHIEKCPLICYLQAVKGLSFVAVLFTLQLLFSPLLGQYQTGDIQQLSDQEFNVYLKSLTDTTSPHIPVNFAEPLPEGYAKADLQILKRVLEEAQTSIYRYCSPAALDSCFQNAMEIAEESMTYLELVQHVARIQHLIACGHSGWSHNPDFFKYRNQHVGLFPFDIRIFEGRFYLVHNNSLQANIPINLELLTLNGVPISQIAADLKKHMYADGISTEGSWMDLEKYFSMAYSNFIGSREAFEFTTPHKNGAMFYKGKVDALKKPEIDSIRAARYPPAEGLGTPLRFRSLDSMSTGIYTIRWFRNEYIKYKGQDFEAFTDSVFSEMADKKFDNLLIDLRGNVGGWTANGKYLLSYLIDKEHPYIQSVETKKYKDFSFAPIIQFKPGYLDTFDLQRNTSQLYEWLNYPSLTAIPKKKNRFKGQVYILIDGHSRSCSSVFSGLARETTDAIFLGEEAGGAQGGSNGIVMAITLPYSGLGIYFSTAKYTAAVSDQLNRHGVIPDIPLPHTKDELMTDEDIILRQAIELIQTKQRRRK